MNKLVCGVGVNDLPYRTQVYEYVTENGGKKIRKLVFICEYYKAWKNMLGRCYSKKYLESHPTYIGTSVCGEWLYATAFKNGWISKTGMVSVWTRTLLYQEANYIPLKRALLFCQQQTRLLLHAMRVEVSTYWCKSL